MTKERGLALTVPDPLLKLFTKSVPKTALSKELTEHLGHEKNRADPHRGPGNIRKGTRPKTVLTEATGQITIDVPTDRDGAFKPQMRKNTATPPERGRGDRAVAICERAHDR